ncbi:MAG TPA: tyrosine-type recombinase/integrase [Ilumatobacteraceae bacterium]|nr:tyrosine-type recombinase/integrase [Ilumatobacteraceae bacterium]
MTGSLRKRGPDSWQLRVYLGVDADTGKQRWATTTVRGSKRYANAQLAEFARQAEYSKVRAGTVNDLLDRWVTAAAPKWAPSTRRENLSIIEHDLKPHLGHVPVGKLTTADIDDFYAYLVHGGGRDGTPLAPGRVTRIHGVLHRAFAQAVRWEWVWFNPVSNASPPRVPPPEVRPPTIDAVVALLHSVRGNDPCLFAYLQLAASTGARRSQLLGLRWGEIGFAQRSIGFTRAFVEGDHGPVLRATKTHRSYSVAIDDSTLAVLVDHWRQAVARAESVGANLTVDSFVFSSDPAGARPWLPNRVTKQFIHHRRRTGLSHFRLHDLRHFMATEMLGHGVPVPTVSQRLGHARASTTLNVYAHRVPGSDRDAADLLGGLLDPNGTPNVDRRRRHTNQQARTTVARRINVASWPTGARTN